MTATKSTFPAAVVKVIAPDRIVINRGTSDGIAEGQRYVVYEMDADILADPTTGEELGRLETPKGTGIITYTQDRMAILYHQTSSFTNPKVGDLVKPV